MWEELEALSSEIKKALEEDRIGVDKISCLYDATQDCNNSIDEVGPGPNARKRLYVNLLSLVTTSRRHLPFDLKRRQPAARPLRPYLEISYNHTLKTLDEAKTEITQHAASKEESHSPVSLLNTETSYRLVVFSGQEPESDAHIEPVAAAVIDTELQQKCPALHHICQSIVEMSSNASIAADSWDCGDETIPVDSIPLDPAPFFYGTGERQLAGGVPPQQKGILPPVAGGVKCMECGKSENLWLNISDGFIGCGRKQYGVDNSGCLDGREGAAIRHYEAHPEYSVCAKLGTITSTTADLYSYSLDSPVSVSNLDSYLSRIGLSRDSLRAYEKTTAELAMTENHTLGKQAAGASAVSVLRAGCIGIRNLGNSCYMSAIFQMLSRCHFGADVDPDKTCSENMSVYLRNYQFSGLNSPRTDIRFQLQRILMAISSKPDPMVLEWVGTVSKYRQALIDGLKKQIGGSVPGDLETYIASDLGHFKAAIPSPRLFKKAFGLEFRRFAGGLQEDPEEFYQCLMSHLEAKGWDCRSLTVEYEEVVLDKSTKEARRAVHRGSDLSLGLPPHYRDADQTSLSFEDLLTAWKYTESEKTATRMGILNYPKYLMIQIRRMTFDEAYQPIKLLGKINVNELINLKTVQAEGVKEEEIEMSSPEVDMLVEMGFDRQLCILALQQSNQNVEVAVEKLMNGTLNDAVRRRVSAECYDYRLIGCVTHLGSNLHSGHYISHTCLHENAPTLYLQNDDLVTMIPDTSITDAAKSAYLLVYQMSTK